MKELTINELLYILGYTVPEEDPLEVVQEALNNTWSFEDSEMTSWDLEKGYTQEIITLHHIPTGKYYSTFITFAAYEGYNVPDNDTLSWYEVEPIETTIIKYLPKQDETINE